MPASIRDVARSAGVSHGTVSKVLNRQTGSYISESTRARVLEVAEKLGYRPHRIARALATGRTNLVALWMTYLDRPFFGQVIHEVQDQARRRGYGIIVGKMNYEFASATDSEAPLLDWPVDGILALDGHDWLDATLKTIGVGVPIVSMGSYHATVADFVGVDVSEGVRDAVAHVHSQGARRIVWLGGNDDDPNDRRTAAYSSAIANLGVKPIFVSAEGHDRKGGYAAIARYLAAGEKLDAVVGYNDDLVIGACRGLRDAGLDSPKDVLLVGVDGTDECEYYYPSISSVKQPIGEMCRLGWEFLENRIREPEMETQRAELTAKLMVRESSVRR